MYHILFISISIIIIIGWAYHDSRPPALSALEGNSKFEILLIKIFSLKRKTKSNTSTYYKRKSSFYSSRRHSIVPSDKGLQWVNAKQAIHTDLRTFRHNQE